MPPKTDSTSLDDLLGATGMAVVLEPDEGEEATPEPEVATTAPKPAAKRKTTAKGKATKKVDGTVEVDAKTAIENAMKLLEPDVEPDISDDDEGTDGKRPAVKRLRPIPRPNGQMYQPRILGDRTDIETVRACREALIPVLLGGYPGCGKTAMLEAAFGEDMLTIEGHGDSEVSDFVGSYVPVINEAGEQVYEWVDGPLPRAMKEGKVLFVDDCTLVPPGVLARLYPAMDGRGVIKLTEHGGEVIEAQPGFFVVGAYNPDAPGSVLSEALASRFLLHIEVESDLLMARDDFGIDKRIIRAAAALRVRRAKGVVSWAPEMRELLGFKRVQDAFGISIAVRNLISVAPEDARDDVIEVVKVSFPKHAEHLALKGGEIELTEAEKGEGK